MPASSRHRIAKGCAVNKTSARLPRVLGLFDVAVLSSASMGPAYSLASTLGLMVAVAGAWTPVALLALTVVMLCVAASFMQLSRVLPHAGSSYAWIGAAFGRKVGAYAAWILLISNFFATMATAVPAGVYTLDLLAPGVADSPVWEAVVGVVWIIVGALLLWLGATAERRLAGARRLRTRFDLLG